MLHERLSQLARAPVPGIEGLLEAPAVAAWVRGAAPDKEGGFLFWARLDDGLPLAWPLAQALDVVRPSGRDMEIPLCHTVPLSVHLPAYRSARVIRLLDLIWASSMVFAGYKANISRQLATQKKAGSSV